MQVSLILAAGGAGTRFRKAAARRNATSSKVLFPIAGIPVMLHAFSAFEKIPEIREAIVAAPAGEEKHFSKIIRESGWRRPLKVVRGGKSRAESVFNALAKASPASGWIMVHDAARPFLGEGALRRLLKEASGAEGAILARKVVPTLKQSDVRGNILRTVDRSALYEAQTPQLVRKDLLKKSYAVSKGAFSATDEAALLEAIGARVKLVENEDWNPKITSFSDARLAEAYVTSQKWMVCVRNGIGRDTHRLAAGRPFWLGGIRIPFDRGPLGHSDGDVLLHAICDAILGAIGAGDIGEWFSDRDPKFKNRPSRKFVESVRAHAAKLGWKPEHVDSVIILEKPKLGAFKQKIRARVAKLLGLGEEAVSIKAKTQEGLGPEGEGLAVTAEALVAMRRAVS